MDEIEKRAWDAIFDLRQAMNALVAMQLPADSKQAHLRGEAQRSINAALQIIHELRVAQEG